LNKNVLEATVLTGNGKGINIYIPRIPIRPTDLPFKFERLKFPLKLAFAFTINKSQGQSLKCTGVLLDEPCFSHGQLYVACSRGGDHNNINNNNHNNDIITISNVKIGEYKYQKNLVITNASQIIINSDIPEANR